METLKRELKVLQDDFSLAQILEALADLNPDNGTLRRLAVAQLAIEHEFDE
jgi:hypothetical protein